MSKEKTTSRSTMHGQLLEQRMSALQRANHVRSARALLKQELRSGRTTISELLASPPEHIMTAKLFDLLLAVPGCGKVKANRFLQRCNISHNKTVGSLSKRQRGEIRRYLKV